MDRVLVRLVNEDNVEIFRKQMEWCEVADVTTITYKERHYVFVSSPTVRRDATFKLANTIDGKQMIIG